MIVCAEGCFTGADDDYPVMEHATNPVIPAEDYRLVLPSAHVEAEDVVHDFCIKTENTNCPDQM